MRTNTKKKKSKKSNSTGIQNMMKIVNGIKEGVVTFTKVLQVFLSKMMVRKKKLRKKEPIVPWRKMSHLWLFAIVFIYDEIVLRLFTGSSLFGHLIFPILFGLAAGLFVNVITTPFNKNVNWLVSVITMSIISIYFITECLVKRTFHVYMTLSSLLTNAGGVMGRFSTDFITTIINGWFVILVFLLPVVIYALVGKKMFPANTYRWPVSVASVLSSVVLSFLTIVLVWIGGTGSLYTDLFDFNRGSETFGLLTGTRLSATRSGTNSLVAINPEEGVESDFSDYKKNVLNIDFDTLIANDDKQYKEIDQYVNSLPGTSMNKYTGLFKGKNLILICAEGWSDASVNEELTPTLYRLIHNGFYFSDFYQPYWGGSTTTGEFSFLLGLVPGYDISSIQDTVGDNNYFTMPNQLQRIGYYTAGYHNWDFDYYERDQTHENLGMNKWIGKRNGIEEIAGVQELDYVSDEMLFQSTIEKCTDMQPFCSYYITMDGHMPYELDDYEGTELLDYVISIVGDGYNDQSLAYFCKQYKFEKGIKALVDGLEEKGIADDTVICICADHYPYYLEDISDLYGFEVDNNLKRDCNSWILWSGCLEEGKELESWQCEIDTPTYSLDIIPTLSNLFGLEYDSRMLVGRDVFSDATPLVMWNDYSWLTTKGYYSTQTGEYFPIEGENDDNYVNQINNLVKSKKDYSTKVRELDYFGHVFGKDEIKDSTSLWKQTYGKKEKDEE
ncbi:MAG: sulfatase-like hydrolase/transferase [Bacillota bacterium]|nr:sulfatase-like hydrolase/transferase [Bacillota bacterium]